MVDLKLNRINELARVAKERDLTDSELAEQKQLREEYIKGYRNNLRSQLDNMVIVDKDGKETNVKDLRKKGE